MYQIYHSWFIHCFLSFPLPWVLKQFQQISFLHLLTCVYIIFTTFPQSLLLPLQNLFHPPVLWFYRRKNIKDNEKPWHFCWFEIKIAIQGDPCVVWCIYVLQPQITSSLSVLFSTSYSPSHSGLCQFKISIFVPIQW
jgi:hypothetical protein